MGKRRTVFAIYLFLLLCGCGAVNNETDIQSVSQISEVTDEVKDRDILPEAIRTILDYTKTEPIEYDDSIVKDIDYYTSLMQEMYGLPYWKAYGAASLALGKNPGLADTMVVRFIDGKAPEGFESLFAGFFLDRYNDAETIQYAQAYAYHLAKYAIEKYSFADFAAGNYREEWLKEKNSKSEYKFDEIDEILEKAEVRLEKGKYVITVGADEWVCGGETWVYDAGELYNIIHNSVKTISAIRNDLETDAPVWYEGAKGRKAVIELYDSEDASYTKPENFGGHIFLAGSYAIAHEYIHALTVRSNLPDHAWLNEGIAERYSLRYEADAQEYHTEFSDVIQGADMDGYLGDMSGKERAEWVEYIESVRKTYNELKASYGDKYSDRIYSYVAEGQEELKRGEVFGFKSYAEIMEYIYDTDVYMNHAENRLSYYSSCMAADILIREYGADKVLLFTYAGGNFKHEFGCTLTEFLDSLKEEDKYSRAFIYDR